MKASITRLTSRLDELQSKLVEPSTLSHLSKLSTKLESLDSEFKVHHYAVVDAIPSDDDADENLQREQDELDQHDSTVADLSVRVEQLMQECSSKVESPAHKVFSSSLTNLQERINTITTALTKLAGTAEETHLMAQYQEQVSDFKKELSDARRTIMTTCTPEVSDSLVNTIIVDIDRSMFDVGLKLKTLAAKAPTASRDTTIDPSLDSNMIKLPKLDVPTFDGNILHWMTFWEQYSVAIHDRTDLSQAQKLVYLRQSLKDGSARNVIEGLSHSGEQYNEAVQCLKERYNRPRLIHQAHVRKILEVPSLKENTGKELRRLHDVLQQHLRALKAMGKEPSASFITSLVEIKLDPDTMFEWQKASQEMSDIPHYSKLLEFLNFRAQAAECASVEARQNVRTDNSANKKQVASRSASFVANATGTGSSCVQCKTEKHPLYVCTLFKSLPRDKMITTIRENNLCMNCLKSGHFCRQCPSLSKCRRCQKPHHTLLHIDQILKEAEQGASHVSATQPAVSSTCNTATSVAPNVLLMTCQVLIHSPDGTAVKACALLDSASSTSFISERLTQTLGLSRSSQNVKITGIAGLSHRSPLHSVVTFDISSTSSPNEKTQVTAVTLPRVTSDLPQKPVSLNADWSHLSGLHLADPTFGRPGKIDILLGIDVYAAVLLHGRRNGPHGSPVAFETRFGWVLAGGIQSSNLSYCTVSSHHTSVASTDELLRKFWEIEEKSHSPTNLSPEERTVVKQFQENHRRTNTGRFIVPLPRKSQAKDIGESRTQAVRRFLTLERSLHSKNRFCEFSNVMDEYLQLQHAELVPVADLHKSSKDVFYLPMHAVRKEQSTTTKLRVVFDASAKSSTGVSLNDTLLVGPTIHPPLTEVILRFRSHRVALTADISKMYRAIELDPSDRDLHRFVWRNSERDPLRDYRMKRVTFGVSASSFAANMAVKQNAIDFATEFPNAADVVDKSLYVDDCLTGADSIAEAITLQTELHTLFSKGGFLLRKWNSSELEVLNSIPADLKDAPTIHSFSPLDEYTKTLGIEWNARMDHFRLTIAKLPPVDSLTKRALVSDIAKTFDVLGWFSPTIIKAKILLQQLWQQKVDWDDDVPSPIYDVWLQWRSQLDLLSEKHIPRCYFHKSSDQITSVQLHGFCDASEDAYAAVVYLRLADSRNNVQFPL